MLLVDDDQTQSRERQKQRRAGADDDAGATIGHRPPRPPALAGGDLGMPDHRRRAEAGLKALQPLRAKRDLRQQDQDLAALGKRAGEGREVDLGLAGPRQSVQKCNRKATINRRAQSVGGGGLGSRQHRPRPLPVRLRQGGRGRERMCH